MGRKWLEECCCVTESLYTYDAAYTPTATDDRFDVKANAVELARPIYGQGEAIYYASASPPTGYHLESLARVKVWDQIEATLTAKLVPRPMPQEWFPPVMWNYDPNSTATSSQGFYPSAAVAYTLLDGYQIDINDIKVPGAIFNFTGGPYTNAYATVEGFTDFPEPAGSGYAAHPGTSLSQLTVAAREGLADIVLYCADMRINTKPTLYNMDGGWITSPFPTNWPNYNFQYPMQNFGYDSSFFLSMEGQSRWVVCTSNDSPGNAYPYYGMAEQMQPGRRRLAWLTLYVSTHLPQSPPGDVSETAFVTAYTHRPRAQILTPLTTGRYRATTAFPVEFFDIVYEDGQSADAYYGYTNTTVKQFKGNEVSVYRNGTMVLSANYPTVSQSRAASQEEGTYLVVNEVTGATDDPSKPAWYGRGKPESHKQFQCVVIDKTPPVVAFEALNDVFGNDNANWQFSSHVIATEPIYGFVGSSLDLDDRGVLIAGVLSSLSGGGVGPRNRLISVDARSSRDLAGNAPERIMRHPLTIHAFPANIYSLGSTVRLTKFERRTRSQGERVQTVRLTFDRKINASQVNASQFTLEKNNEPISGLTVEPEGDGSRFWLINVPVSVQEPRSFFLLTYNPGGNVYTDDIVTVRLPSRSAFPTTGAYRTKYVFEDAGGVDQWFSWSQSGYISIPAGSPPLAPNGQPFTPEPCVLAARTSWIMADENGRPRMINCDSYMLGGPIGRVASIGFSRSIDTTKTATEVESNEPGMPVISYDPRTANPVYGRTEEIKFRRYENRRGFIPAVPSPTSPRAGCSWFGLTTTIDPSPPAAVHECAAPSEHQKHSSAIISDTEITGFIVSLEMRDGNGNLITDFSGDKAWPYGGLAYDINNPGDAARKIMAIGGIEYTFGATLQGRPLSQNVWSCIDGARNAEYVSEVIPTSNTTLCSENGQKYYSFRMTQNGGTVFARGSRGGKIRTARAVFKQDGVQATITAFRDWRTYPSLYTTTLSDLTLSFSFRMAINRTTTYTEYGVSGSPIGYSPFNYELGGVCPSYLKQSGDFAASAYAVYHESQMQQIGDSREVVGRFFDYVSGATILSKQEEIALGQGQTITKEPFVITNPGFTPRIWTLKIRRA